jgi:hypothetical protein
MGNKRRVEWEEGEAARGGIHEGSTRGAQSWKNGATATAGSGAEEQARCTDLELEVHAIGAWGAQRD